MFNALNTNKDVIATGNDAYNPSQLIHKIRDLHLVMWQYIST